jgi:hypothetical protein
VKLEAKLRLLVLRRLQDCALPPEAQTATSTLPELTLEPTLVADLCAGLDAEAAITLNKLKQSVQCGGGGARSAKGSLAAAGDSAAGGSGGCSGGSGGSSSSGAAAAQAPDDEGDLDGDGGGGGGALLPPLVVSDISWFNPCEGWSKVKSGRRDMFRKDGLFPEVEVCCPFVGLCEHRSATRALFLPAGRTSSFLCCIYSCASYLIFRSALHMRTWFC